MVRSASARTKNMGSLKTLVEAYYFQLRINNIRTEVIFRQKHVQAFDETSGTRHYSQHATQKYTTPNIITP